MRQSDESSRYRSSTTTDATARESEGDATSPTTDVTAWYPSRRRHVVTRLIYTGSSDQDAAGTSRGGDASGSSKGRQKRIRCSKMMPRVQPNIQTPDRLKFRPMEMQHDRGGNSASPRDEDAGGEATSDPVDNLQTYFDAAMARFLHELQVQQAYQAGMEAREGRGAPVTAAQEGPRVRTHIFRQRTMTDAEMEASVRANTTQTTWTSRDRWRGWRRLQWDKCRTWSLASRLQQPRTSRNSTEAIKMKTEHVTGCPQ